MEPAQQPFTHMTSTASGAVCADVATATAPLGKLALKPQPQLHNGVGVMKPYCPEQL
jgi:hypothetical protein